jgi:hypothetical protein
MNTVKLIHPIAFLMAALIGLTVGACGKHSEMRVDRVCMKHCHSMKDCADTDYDTCVNNCVETANACASDSDVEMALDKLEECHKQKCSEILACGIEAWVECKI